jgi:hypothetical protein
MSASKITLLTTIGFLVAQSALGNIYDPEPNKLGLYFTDVYGDWYQCANSSPSTIATAYILLTNPTFSSLHKWEAAIRQTNGLLFFLGESIGGGGVNSGSELEFVVSYETPISLDSVTILATVDLFYVHYPGCLILTGVSNPSLPEYLPLVWPEEGSPMVIQTTKMYPNGVVATLDGCGTVPEVPAPCSQVVGTVKYNWGTLKSTYG